MSTTAPNTKPASATIELKIKIAREVKGEMNAHDFKSIVDDAIELKKAIDTAANPDKGTVTSEGTLTIGKQKIRL